MIHYISVQELVEIASGSGRNISDVVLEDQAIQLG